MQAARHQDTYLRWLLGKQRFEFFVGERFLFQKPLCTTLER